MALPPERALVTQRPPPGAEKGGAAAAEQQLRAALALVTELDLELEALSLALGDFSRAYEQTLGAAFAEIDLAERLVRRLQTLEDEVARLTGLLQSSPAGLGLGSHRPKKGRRARHADRSERKATVDDTAEGPDADLPESEEESAAEAAEIVEPEEVVLKRLYRRLARVLHPDLARDDGERKRLGDLMAKVNAAYDKRDRTALELMAEKVGAGELLEDLSEEERIAHLEGRIASLRGIADSLRRERNRLQISRTHRLYEESNRRHAEGRDYFEETRAELADEARQAEADARSRMVHLAKAARELARARSKRMSNLKKTGSTGPTGALRAFDPLSESALVRKGVAHLERQRATGEARELAHALEEAIVHAPSDAALTLLAFFAEAAGRPPDSLASSDGWAERYETLAADWPEAPSFERALARLPCHLEIGLRAYPDKVISGVQLRAPELLAGVRIALERVSFAALARRVLQSLGPREKCSHCGETGYAIHFLRTRGLDELNGLACPHCAGVLRSYWRYGELEGLEALQPYALQLGVVTEQVVRLAGAAIGFQFLPAERDRLTAQKLRQRIMDIYFEPYGIEMEPGHVRIETRKGPLGPAAKVPSQVAIRIALDPACGHGESEVLELLRSRIERRFRPDARARS